MESQADYITNFNTGSRGPAAGSDEYRLMEAQYADRLRADQQGRQIDQWMQGRNPYYETLYNQQVQAGSSQAQQGYNDAIKRTKLQHAARGTSGSSQEVYNDAQLSAAAQMQAAQAAQMAQTRVQGIRQQDLANAQQMKISAMAPSPYLEALYNAFEAKYNSQRADEGSSHLAVQRLRDQQHYMNNMSQVYGQAIGNAMTGVQSFAGGAV